MGGLFYFTMDDVEKVREMLKFIPYASGSTGNLYEVTDSKTRILLECGLPIKEIQRLTGHQLSKFRACLVTHQHRDHSASFYSLPDRGVDMFLGEYIFSYSDSTLPLLTLEAKAFEVPHSAPNFGFIIRSNQTTDTMIFMTDLSYCPAPFDFSPTIFALECNFTEDLIPPNCEREKSVFGAHMSLDTCIKTFKANDLRLTREIWLLHISTEHGDPERFVREVQAATGVPTHAAPAYKKKGER